MSERISLAAEHINQGKVIAFPTETVYGLAADAINEEAINRIYQIKGRDSSTPMQVMVKDYQNAQQIGVFNENAEKLANKFWPGALTIIVERKDNGLVSPIVSRGRSTIGIRIPDHEIALDLLKEFSKALATTSANISGEDSLLNAKDISKTFGEKIDFIIDGGVSDIGIASTVVDCTTSEVKILREGAISEDQVLEAIS